MWEKSEVKGKKRWKEFAEERQVQHMNEISACSNKARLGRPGVLQTEAR